MLKTIVQLVLSLRKRRKVQLIILLGLVLLSAIAEMISLGAIIPFVGVLINPEKVLQNKVVENVIQLYDLNQVISDPAYWFTVVFIAIVFIAGVIRLLLVFILTRVNFGIGHDLGVEIYRRTLYQPYKVHISRNSSEIISAMNKVDSVVLVLQALLYFISSFIVSLFIITTLFLVNPQVTIISVLFFTCFYTLIILTTRSRLKQYGLNIRQAHTERVKILQEGLGGIRDILLDHLQEAFSRKFNKVDRLMRRSQSNTFFLSPSPRYIIETGVIILIALLSFKLIGEGEVVDIIPMLGVLALGAQRLLPLLQQMYAGWVNVSANYPMIDDVIALTQQPMDMNIDKNVTFSLVFRREIIFNNVSFAFNSKNILNSIKLNISKGSRIGFIGSTGSGKSTLMDVLMGMLHPSHGGIFIDDIELNNNNRINWQKNIAHVPQSIYLSDNNFINNIAFGIPEEEIDIDRVYQSAKKANISEVIENSLNGYKTMVGERGVRLSGGQQQRIGIARALYKNASVLILDEATSALDSHTETTIMKELSRLDDGLTILIVAHRLNTLRDCDKIYQLDQGNIIASGTFDELITDKVIIR